MSKLPFLRCLTKPTLFSAAWILGGVLSIAWADGPQATRIYPSGGQRGQTVAVAVTGAFPSWPPAVWTEEPGVVWKPLAEQGKFEVAIAADATPGIHRVRFYDAPQTGGGGVSPVKGFVVGVVPEVLEVEPNDDATGRDTKRPPQRIASLPTTVNAIVANRDVDAFVVSVKRGETLVASIEGNRGLKSPMDATLQIVDTNGFVLKQTLDARGLDPLIAYTASVDRDVIVRVFAFPEQPDGTVLLGGSDLCVYRLTLTTGGFVEAGRPMATLPDLSTEIRPRGFNLANDAPRLLLAKTSRPERAVAFDSMLPGVASVALVPFPPTVESGDTEPASPQPIMVPSLVSGAIEREGDQDAFEFAAQANQRFTIKVESRSLDFPLDPLVSIVDAAGKSLGQFDDEGERRDPAFVWVAPADGAYKVIVEDRHRHGGMDFLYRLTIQQESPEYRLTFKQDVVVGKVGEPIDLPITVNRIAGFAEQATVSLVGLPDGVACEPVVSEPTGDSAKEVRLKIQFSAPFVGALRVEGSLAGDATRRTIATLDGTDALELWLIAR